MNPSTTTPLRRAANIVGAAAIVLAAQSVVAPPAWACHFLSTTSATDIPGGFTFLANATTSGNGNSDWGYEIVATTPAGLTPAVTWVRVSPFPGGAETGGPDPTSHPSGDGMRFTVSGLSAGDEVTVRVFAFTGVNGDCTGANTSRRTSDVIGTVVVGAPPASAPEPRPPLLACEPTPALPASTVTCEVSRGDPGIDMLWGATVGGTALRGGVTLDGDGRGRFSFVVPIGAPTGDLVVELLEWGVDASLPVVPAATPTPTAVAAGDAPTGAPVALVWSGAAAAGLAGYALRRFRRAGIGA